PLAARPPGAESIEQVIDRARVFLDEVLSRHSAGSKLLVVAHGGSIRGVIIAGLGLPTHVYRQLHFSNGSLSVIELGNDPGIRLLNDTCHLGSSRSDGEEI
ncbi:MAG: histidine phosphatase family protein, partial [Armatimonadota bacterium]